MAVAAARALRKDVAQSAVGSHNALLRPVRSLNVIAREGSRQFGTRRRGVVGVVAGKMLVEPEHARGGQRAPEDVGDADAPRDRPGRHVEVIKAEAHRDLSNGARIDKFCQRARYGGGEQVLRVDPGLCSAHAVTSETSY